MEKNDFLIYNDILYELYSCSTMDDIQMRFLPRLKMLIPFSYASILLADTSNNPQLLFRDPPFCLPQSFTEAESEYIRHYEEDPLLWIIHGKEPALICESELLQEETRLHTSLYNRCYLKYDIYDSLQYSIVYKQKFLGVITLFRTRSDGTFHAEHCFFLRSCGMHLNTVMHRILHDAEKDASAEHNLTQLTSALKLTAREAQILRMIFAYKTNQEIAAALSIKENTLQKHLQNLFRKANVSSKWELLKL